MHEISEAVYIYFNLELNKMKIFLNVICYLHEANFRCQLSSNNKA